MTNKVDFGCASHCGYCGNDHHRGDRRRDGLHFRCCVPEPSSRRAVRMLLKLRAHRKSTDRPAWVVVVNVHRLELERLLVDQPEHDAWLLFICEFGKSQFSML